MRTAPIRRLLIGLVVGALAVGGAIVVPASAQALSFGSVEYTGIARVGSTVSVEFGLDGLSPTPTLTIHWQDITSDTTVGTGTTHTFSAAELGHKVEAVADMSGSATGTLTAFPLTVSAGEIVATARTSGTLTVGSKLAVVVSALSPSTATITGYQWYWDNETPITGATSSTYTPTSADLGHGLVAVIAMSAPAYEDGQIVSAFTGPVLKAITAPKPTISGTLAQGSTLTVKLGATTPSNAARSYAWYRGAAVIAGATKSTYTLGSADGGKQIHATVTLSASGFASAVLTSSATAPIKAVFSSTPTPKISGTAKVGKTLSVKPGWKPAPKYAYQWFANGKAIAKATKTTLKLTSKQAGKKITVRVTATKSGYVTVTKVSHATAKVKR